MSKILVIAEKPSAGKDIARILGVTENKGGYMENDDYIITWAIGHLISLKDPEDIDEKYKKWELDNIPLPINSGLKVKEKTKEQFYIIKKLIARNDIEYLINAGDAGREGLLIQSWIYRAAGNKHPVKLLWASSLTAEAIKTAMSKLHDESEKEFVNLLREAETRAISDQILGYNYTRLLTCLYGSGRTVLSYGRCQTPLLNLIAKRDLEYENFKSEPYWTFSVGFEDGFTGIEIDDDGKTPKYMSKSEADKVLAAYKDKEYASVLSCNCSDKSSKAPELFNLAELQGVMGRKYGYTPNKTLQIAQDLYEKHKIMSYPRTDSRFLSTDLYGEIKQHLMCCSFGKFKPYIDEIDFAGFQMNKIYFNDNKVSDHHALIPTINSDIASIYERMTDDEKNCFDEIVVSLIAIFYPDYQYKTTELILELGDKRLKATGMTIINSGYKAIYQLLKSNTSENQSCNELPNYSEGMRLKIDNISMNEDKTKPPAKYNPGNIIKLMGKYKIGTSATSAGIVQSLIDRKFVKLEKNRYVSTELGRNFLKFVPAVLKSPNMTIEFEERLQKVNSGEISQDEFINGLLNDIADNKKYFIEHYSPNQKLDAGQSIGKCPICSGNMREGKKSWYCENYSTQAGCKFTIWKEISGKKLSDADARKILQDGKSGLIKGFVTKNSGKKFSAYLVLDENKELTFKFPKQTQHD